MKKRYRSFNDARKFVRKLKLQNVAEWRQYTKSKNFPSDFPVTPEAAYKNKGWNGYGNFLGTGNIAPFNRTYIDFRDARKFVHSLKLKDSKDWSNFCKSGKKPKDIPSDPRSVYKKEWKSMGDWLDTGSIASFNRSYKLFSDARKFVHSLKLKNGNDWRNYCKSGKKPEDIPNTPSSVYKNEYVYMGDWLGTGNIPNTKRKFLPFHKVRKFVHSLNLKSETEWKKYYASKKRPLNIPSNPKKVYPQNFKGFGDWLGTGNANTRERVFRDFKKARIFVHSLNLKGVEDWRRYTKSKNFPNDFPVTPEKSYKNKGWKGYGDFLGTGNVATQEKISLRYNNAKKIIQKWNFIKTQQGWNKYVRTHKIPSNIPKAPVAVYGSDWISWGDWLGTGSMSSSDKSKQYMPWKDAKIIYQKLAKENNLKTKNDWYNFIKTATLPDNLPPYPDRVYTKARAKKLQT